MDMWEAFINSSQKIFHEIGDINSNNNGNKITNRSKKNIKYNYCILLELLIRWRWRETMEKRLRWLGLTVNLRGKKILHSYIFIV